MKKSNKTYIKCLISQKAFSLIEVLLVFLIMGFLFAVVSQKFFNKTHKVRAVFDGFIQLNKRLVSISTLHNKTYRLVFQLDTEKKDQYWVEKKQTVEKFKTKEKIENEEETKDDFQIDESFYHKPQKVPSLLDITKINTKSAVKEEGKVYIYYYPSVLAQETRIYFLRPGNRGVWTLYLDPVTRTLEALKGEK